MLHNYSIRIHFCALLLKGLDQLDFLSPCTQTSEPTVNSVLSISTELDASSPVDTQRSGGSSHKFMSSLHSPWRGRHLMHRSLAGQSYLKIIGHHSVWGCEQNACSLCGTEGVSGLCQALTTFHWGQFKVKDLARVERGWSSSCQLMLHLHISNVGSNICIIPLLCSLYIPFKSHLLCPHRETTDSLK